MQALPETPVIFWVEDKPVEEQMRNIVGYFNASDKLAPTEANDGRMRGLGTHNADRFDEGLKALARRIHLPTWPKNKALLTLSFPVSIVIPSFSRVSTLPGLIGHVLSLSSMQHPYSEVLVAHVSQESWEQRLVIQRKIKDIMKNSDEKNKDLAWKVVHMNYVELNAEMGCASRYFAATKATNDVIVHLDDDIWPEDDSIRKMILLVVMENGFPKYEDETNIPQFYGFTRRLCGRGGYHAGEK